MDCAHNNSQIVHEAFPNEVKGENSWITNNIHWCPHYLSYVIYINIIAFVMLQHSASETEFFSNWSFHVIAPNQKAVQRLSIWISIFILAGLSFYVFSVFCLVLRCLCVTLLENQKSWKTYFLWSVVKNPFNQPSEHFCMFEELYCLHIHQGQ